MKILHVITGLNDGGAEGVLYRLCAGDLLNGDKHIVISMTDRGIYADRLEQCHVIVYCLNLPKGRVTTRGLSRLYRIIRHSKPDIIQTWMYHANLIADHSLGHSKSQYGSRQKQSDNDAGLQHKRKAFILFAEKNN